MQIGVGVDTGGTYTDAVIYQFEQKKILAYAKSPTTKADLSVGVGRALDALPPQLVQQAQLVALSTTLATNACVENKGGRAKLVFFGVSRDTVARVGLEYGLALNDSLIFVNSITRPNGQIVSPPDWQQFQQQVLPQLRDCDAVALVELYANKSGAVLEKQAREIIRQQLDLSIVCGHSLFNESNIIKRGASALLNARLLSVVESFLQAAHKSLQARNIQAPVVIVRSDGSLMSAQFTASRPVETLLCGPVASVMGARQLSDEPNCLVVDIGGTTTDLAFVKQGQPRRSSDGVSIGQWRTMVKGLFVDTFGLGGDSGVAVGPERQLLLQAQKALPLCMAASEHPQLVQHLRREYERGDRLLNQQKNIYLRVRQLSSQTAYTARERELAAAFDQPRSLEQLQELNGDIVLESQLQRLLQEGVLLRCGLTPTDVMHVRGDFTAYNVEAAQLGLALMARGLGLSPQQLAEQIYDEFQRKLYVNLLRALLQDAYPQLAGQALSPQLELLLNDAYRRAVAGEQTGFLNLSLTTAATLVGVGAPTAIFLPTVARLLGAKVVLSEYSAVANALGAVVGQVAASTVMEVVLQQENDVYLVFGCGRRLELDSLQQAKQQAQLWAKEQAMQEAVARGAEATTLEFSQQEAENIINTEFGPLYMGYKVTVTAQGQLRLH